MPLRNGSPKELYQIWSIEHDAWRMPGGKGYTKNPTGAGDFTKEEALSAMRTANLSTTYRPREALVPVLFK